MPWQLTPKARARVTGLETLTARATAPAEGMAPAYLNVFTVEEYESNGKTQKKWTKIGAAFPHTGLSACAEPEFPRMEIHRSSGRCGIAIAQKVSSGASRGKTHASNGRPWTGRPGLARSMEAQRNEFTAFRQTNFAPRSPVHLVLNLFPPSAFGNSLFEHFGIRIGYLLHHALAREQARERCAPIAPVFPGVVRPILVSRAIRCGSVEPEGLEESCVAPDRKSTRLNSSHQCLSRMPSSA